MTATTDSIVRARMCRVCSEIKPLDAYPKRHGDPTGYTCNGCVNERQNNRRAERLGLVEKQSLAKRNSDLRISGKQECKSCRQVKTLDQYRKKTARITLECLDCLNSKQRAAYARNENGLRERLKEHQKKQSAKHAVRISERQREYVARNRAKITDRQNEWSKEKLRSDPVFALKKRIRSLISNSFAFIGSSKNQETQAILGCTFDDFRAHIARQFLSGMTWDRMGREIHIDHIVPLATAVNEQDVIALNHFTNLRPMWARDNISKGAKAVALL